MLSSSMIRECLSMLWRFVAGDSRSELTLHSPQLLAQPDVIDSNLEPHNAWVVSLPNTLV